MLFLNYLKDYYISNIQIAYVLNDCAISFIKEIKTLYKSYKLFYYDSHPQPKLKFPLIKTSKIEIYNELSIELKQYIWSCEVPTIIENTEEFMIYQNCGECEACKKEKMLDIYDNKTFKLLKSKQELIICDYNRNDLVELSEVLNEPKLEVNITTKNDDSSTENY